ncbi:D-2-hydroxyacid dehydrogenase [Rhizobiaceae bacterium BDR2-2]|uniref:D-2-hydroxyacid dehydrogenase n=1 Tax=Ectorhizobium quercum TaxID=2965071 RepID=A0AAE3STB8_9HYPH|nr:D-2-hydroxyacid dehydrogenase [Ectorhizobium quercum]MCX8995528.1 D-2-hydroxyacid dehydrogenase [Ectorhizobium quercum]
MTLTNTLLPPRDKLKLLFAHGAYDMKPIFDAKDEGIETMQVSTYDDLRQRLPEADVLIVSGLWKNDLLDHAPRLKYLQSVSSGTNQYDTEAFKKRGILLASGQGVNMNAVSEHAIGLILSLTRRLALARDNQHRHHWRPEQRDPAEREGELPGKTMLLVGLGRIGDRIARLAKAFGMHVIGVRRNPQAGAGSADEVHAFTEIKSLIPRADIVVLSCPLTDETRNIIDREALALFARTAFLVNVARGGCVEEDALIEALEAGRIAGAGLDVTQVEPLPAESRLWSLPNVIITPHAAGETTRYEMNVLDILSGNLAKLWNGDAHIVNRIA